MNGNIYTVTTKRIMKIAIEDKGDPGWHSFQSITDTRIEADGYGQISWKRKQTNKAGVKNRPAA